MFRAVLGVRGVDDDGKMSATLRTALTPRGNNGEIRPLQRLEVMKPAGNDSNVDEHHEETAGKTVSNIEVSLRASRLSSLPWSVVARSPSDLSSVLVNSTRKLRSLRPSEC